MKKLVLLLVLCWTQFVWAGVTTFQKPASPANPWDSTYDAMIGSSAGSRNYGGYEFLNLEKATLRRAIISFPNIDQHTDFDADDCDSCFLELKLAFVLEDSLDLKVAAYLIDSPWTEGVASGAPWDDTNYVAWNYRNDGTLTANSRTLDTTWTAGGKFSTVFDTTGIAEVINVSYQWRVSKTACSTWVVNPSSNYGMLLKYLNESGGSPHRYWYSSEHATAANHPKFLVYWTTRSAEPVSVDLTSGLDLGVGDVGTR